VIDLSAARVRRKLVLGGITSEYQIVAGSAREPQTSA